MHAGAEQRLDLTPRRRAHLTQPAALVPDDDALLALPLDEDLAFCGAIPGIDNAYWHVATEPYGPEGVYGEWLTYLMVLVPAAWLALAWRQDRHASTADGARTA